MAYDDYRTNCVLRKVEIYSSHVLQIFDKHAPIITKKNMYKLSSMIVNIMSNDRVKLISKYKPIKLKEDRMVYKEMCN